MLLHKTELARALLAHNGSELTRQERQVLILCDGQRTLEQLVSMLGVEALGMIQKMIAGGYISHSAVASPTQKESRFGKLMGGLRGAASAASQAIPAAAAQFTAPTTATIAVAASPAEAIAVQPNVAAVAPAHTAAMHASTAAAQAITPVTASRPASRRSMAASKMYMIDMLQLQRTPDAASLAVTLQTSRDEEQLVAGFIDALVYLVGATKQTVSARVAERLKEIIPDEHLGAVETAWVQMTTQFQLDPAVECEVSHAARASNVVSIAPSRVA